MRAVVFAIIVALPPLACGLMVSGDGDDPAANGSTSGGGGGGTSSSGDGALFYEDGNVVVIPGDDGGGSTAKDGSSVADAPIDTYVPPPNSGNALRFNNGSHVSVGTALAIPSDFTLEAWIRPMTFNNERYIVAKDRQGQSAAQFRLGVDNGGRLFFIMSDTGGDSHGLYTTEYRLISPAAVATNVWSHVAVTKSGAQFSLLINGTAVSNVTATASFVYGGPAVDFRIGARVASNGTDENGGFDGAVDEVRLWNVARAPATIAAQRSMAIVPPYPANLTAYFRFDEGAGRRRRTRKAPPTARSLTHLLGLIQESSRLDGQTRPYQDSIRSSR